VRKSQNGKGPDCRDRTQEGEALGVSPDTAASDHHGPEAFDLGIELMKIVEHGSTSPTVKEVHK
jgi:hypothetical protein